MKQRSRRSRRLARTAAAAALAYAAVAAPASATESAPTPSPAAPSPAATGSSRTFAPAWGLNPAPGADCPPGSSRMATLASATFESGNAGPFGSSMTITAEGGNRFARHVGTGSPVAEVLGAEVPGTASARVYITFAVRGDFGGQDLAVAPRYRGTAWTVASAAQAQADPNAWRTVHFDLTDGANESSLGDPFGVVLARDAASTTRVDVDNVEIYQCSPPPMGEPGDFNGDGFADAKFVMRDGSLLFSAGTPTVSRTLWRGGVGWASMTWIGSAGDSNGDGYADLLARTGSGDLLAYYGDGVRTFPTARRIGNGWQWMTSILPVGDVDGNGYQDLIARGSDGLMRFYSFRSDGTLAGGRVVGNGWQGFTHVIAIRTSTPARTPTRLYAIQPNGDMRSYTVTSTGDMYGLGTVVGTGWFFPKVASVGDWDGDGMDDVLGVRANGSAYIYPTNGQGRWKSIKTLEETIWGAALLVG